MNVSGLGKPLGNVRLLGCKCEDQIHKYGENSSKK